MQRDRDILAQRSRRLCIEALEPRVMLDADVLPWGGDAHLTLSFVPDGTHIAGLSSTLFSSFNAVAPQVEWQDAILRAFQTWAVETNAAVGVVPDGGQPFGVSGATRSDPRFGDIRIGAAPLASGTFAIAIPAGDILSGTWVGDVIFNSEATLTNVADMFAVALHEAGHIFGLEHSLDPLSPMHVHGITPVTNLTSGDVTDLQQRHGQPHPDQNELDDSNDTLSDATHLELNKAGLLPEGSAPSVVYGKLSAIGDLDYFRIEMPAGYAGALSFQLRTRGISVLAPRMRILDANGAALAEIRATQLDGDLLSFTLPTVTPDRRYYVVVDSSRTDALAFGDYSLFAKLDGRNVVAQSVIDHAADGSLRFLPQDEIAKLFGSDDNEVSFNDDLHSDDDAETGLALPPTPGFALGTRYETIGGVVDSSDVDFYVVESPGAGGPVMTVRVRSLETAGLAPRIAAYDQDGAPLPVRVLVNGGGEVVAQVSNVAGESEIRLSISAADSTGPFNTGNYQLVIGFGTDEVLLETAAEGTLTPDAPIDNQALYVGLPQLFHFALNVGSAPQVDNSAVIARIYDSQDQIVYQVAARPGETRSAGSTLLKPGSYRVEFTGVAKDGALARDLTYAFLARASSDPFVGDPDDPTFQPVYECPDLPGFFCYPGGYISPNPFLWDDFLATLSDPPPLSPAQLAGLFLGDWWTWVWAQSGANGPPLAQDDTFLQLPGDAGGAAAVRLPLNVLSNDLDPEGGPMIAVLRTTTAHGSLTLLADGTVDYVPAAGFAGVDLFTYTTYDFSTESQVATVRISVGLRGDADLDKDVDGADFLLWQRSLGASATPPGSGADFDGNGTIDGADIVAWRDNFGVALNTTLSNRGDFDGDGEVDGDDLLVWQRTLGDAAIPAGAGADGNADGTVNAPDLTTWSNNFGMPQAVAASVTAATEIATGRATQLAPTTFAAIALGIDARGLLGQVPSKATSRQSSVPRAFYAANVVSAAVLTDRAGPQISSIRHVAIDRVFGAWPDRRDDLRIHSNIGELRDGFDRRLTHSF